MIDQNTNDAIVAEQINIKDKYLLTIKEAVQYFNIGENKLRELTNDQNCTFVLWNGNKRLIKRKEFEVFLDSSYSF
ncbi:excisionase [Gallibacter intestinalis]|uniref:Helix-turn-helix domain-containing protein n=1 Tax=Gallibacter intestinalis TaxID=2779356 RepID=A0ABR9QYC7_9FIRM|nr:excisionase [Gallibacter intestinalis]MBE5035742.1 helix-turn-helix domain-containing protein [Gallibacter intestinalis]